MKTTDAKERLKALMRRHTETAASPTPTPTPLLADRAVPRVPATSPPPITKPTVSEVPKASWDRVTIRLTAEEIQKVNDLVIATQQATRMSKITTTDILRVALKRVGDKNAISSREISELRAVDGRFAKGAVRQA